MQDADLTHKVIGCAMKVHGTLGTGYLESIYERALAHELHKAGLRVECQKALRVTYDGIVVGDHLVDMVIEGHLIVENKAVRTLTRAHEAQLVSYLTTTGTDVGLLLNFGGPSLQFRRKHRVYRSRAEEQVGQD